MILYEIISWICLLGFAFNIWFILWLISNYQRPEHAERNNFFAFLVQLMGVLAQWYSIINGSENWYIKSFSLITMIASSVSFYGTYKHGVRK